MTRCYRLLVLLSLTPMCLAAQGSSFDTSGFHAGQWGVQVGTGGSLVNVGVLRFTGARSAWMLLVDFSGEFLNGTQSSLGTTTDAKEHSVNVGVGVGKRFYQDPRHKVRSFQSIGLAGSYLDRRQTLSGSAYTFTDWSAGLFGELGAGYWVTPNLSLGATGTLSAGYSHRKNGTSGNTLDEHGWFLSGVHVFLVVGLYF